ncbi:MAG: SAM-dependent methyltransferase [Rhodobacteraceae bacterium]|nr:MAG: SAM-dependent methyltransferase [Paracoccaceae bacterium]|tara:strand:+ start:167 stop:988 length:822 start_codon:yes stop_codon:yes gene_type:complete
MSINRKIFDTNALKIKQMRAQKLGYVDFIHRFAINFSSEILSDIKRTFSDSVIIGNNPSLWATGLGFKDAVLIDESDNLNIGKKKFDLAIHALSLHRCNDPVGQLIQVRQALKPDGLMLAFFLGGETLRELRKSFEAAEINKENGISPRVFPMIEIKNAGNLLVRAGFSLSVADKTDLNVSYKSPVDLIYDLRRMGETSILVDRRRSFLRRSTFNEFVENYFSSYRILNGKEIRATFQLLCITGWAPANNQQQPLKPGSAKQHFSKVLKTYKL